MSDGARQSHAQANLGVALIPVVGMLEITGRFPEKMYSSVLGRVYHIPPNVPGVPIAQEPGTRATTRTTDQKRHNEASHNSR